MLESTGLKGEWARKKHGEKRPSWRKVHIGVDARTGEIRAHALTDVDTSDRAVAGALVASSGGHIRREIADGACDGGPAYDAVRAARPSASPPRIVIPTHRPSIPGSRAGCGWSERELHALWIAVAGRMRWQAKTDYGLRKVVEAAAARLKQILCSRLTAQTFGAQIVEIRVAIAVANRSIRAAKPAMVRVRRSDRIGATAASRTRAPRPL